MHLAFYKINLHLARNNELLFFVAKQVLNNKLFKFGFIYMDKRGEHKDNSRDKYNIVWVPLAS